MCDHLSIAGAIVVGHSLGGAVAVQVAATRPDLAAAVVMLDGALLFRDEVVEGVAPLFDAVQSPACAALCPHVQLGRTVGLGHLQMLASPAQVAAMIDQFVVTSPPDHAAA